VLEVVVDRVTPVKMLALVVVLAWEVVVVVGLLVVVVWTLLVDWVTVLVSGCHGLVGTAMVIT